MRTLFIENRDEINRIIQSCKTCYLAMSENGQPYVLPMNFALEGDACDSAFGAIGQDVGNAEEKSKSLHQLDAW